MRIRLCGVLLLCLCLAPLVANAGAVVKIMPLGDSVTRGGPLPDTTCPSYRYYLDQSLRASGYGVDFVGSLSSGYAGFTFDQQHEGHGGYSTGMMVGSASFSPLSAWLAASPTPEIVLLHVGTNDLLDGVPVTTRLANVKQIVTLLRQKNPKVRVLVAQIIPTGNATLNANGKLADFNAGLPPLAASLSTTASPVTVVDLYTGYNGATDNQPDGVHPATSGEKKMAQAWQRALAPILAGTSPAPTPTAVTTTPVPAPTACALPGTLEAENYNAGGEGVGYHDTTPTNQGGAYRNDGVDIEALPGGGYAVGWVRDGEWLKCTVKASSAGQYRAAFRVAAWGSVAHAIEVQVNGNPAATVAVPATGAYDAWTTAIATVALPAGTSTIRLRFVGDGQNLDRVVFSKEAVTTAPTAASPTPTQSSSRPVPGTLQAEDYLAGGEGVGYHDTTPTNQGGAYRNDAVDIEPIAGGGYTVCYVRDGEWLKYSVTAASAGQYRAAFRVAAWGAGSHAIEVQVNGNTAATVSVPTTGGYGTWTTTTATVTLPAGASTIRLRFVGDGQNLDSIAFTAVPSTTAPPTASPTPTQSSSRPVPGALEAEDYDAGGEGVGYHDTTPTNQGGAYRNDGVDIEALPGGGYAVGWVRDGEWLKYTVKASSAGQYGATFRVAAWGTGTHAVEVQVNGNTAATVAVPTTGAYDAWTTATTTLTLPAGTSTIRLRFVGDGQNLDRVTLATAATPIPTAVTTTPAPAPTACALPGTLEAENYNAGGEGVGYHDTTPTNQGGAYRNDGVDIEPVAGGGYTVCYVRDGEWLKYTVTAASAGQYRAAFRVAAWGTGSHAIEVQVNGNPVATVAVPATGGYGTWTTATAALTLPAGTSTLRFRFVGDGQNLDRVDIPRDAVTTAPTSPTPAPTTTIGTVLLPATIQAENYNTGGEGVSYHDTTPGNSGGSYRGDDVDIVYAPSIPSYVVTRIAPGEWLEYSVDAPVERDYLLAFRLSSPSGGQSFEMRVDGSPQVTVMVPTTGSLDAYTTISTQVHLTKGVHRLRVQFSADGQNFDAFGFT